jgi:hypothetical protein
MAALRPITADEAEISFRFFYPNSSGTPYLVEIKARWKTWYGWAADVVLPEENRFQDSPRYAPAVQRAIDDLNRRVGMTFHQFEDILV